MEAFITDLFMKCVYILQVMGGAPGEYGYGYCLANIHVFVVLQPGLILLFFLLSSIERQFHNFRITFEPSLFARLALHF